MKNTKEWKPTKYIYKNNKLCVSKNKQYVSTSSRMTAQIVADYYNFYIKKYCKGRLIDLGCGRVPLYEAYKDYVTEIVCVDWKNSLHENKFIDVNADLNKKLPFKDKEFNSIILSDVLEHIYNFSSLWKEMYRILANKGILILNTPFFYWIHEQPHDYYRYTQYSLKKNAEEVGFKIKILDSIGGSPETFIDFFSKHFIHVPLLGLPLTNIIQNLALFLRKTKKWQEISKKSSYFFPLGYFLIAEKI